ncbi:YqkE family protein [Paenibacillus chibensis]|uniref:YqkE family protein n=1 Tax=Paenibacillus chibensis TaxID=59846 RepID=A0ABU6Q0J6_9BACL|nr:YqkE family protein [Paenibacillus chibensis]MEC0373660.1 YqkE family protein [Paenibacillus chibensis]MED5020654.1 YqkE family protein [Paenibacillus chibensis]
MAKKRKQDAAVKPQAADKPATLKDLLSSDVLNKLKQQSVELKAEEQQKKEAQLKKAEEERKAEQKRRDNDFEYLLENSSMDWKKYK